MSKKNRNNYIKVKRYCIIILTFILVLSYGSRVVKASDIEPITTGFQTIHANKLEWIPISKDNPLGGADNFNAIVFDEFKNFHETGGPVASRKINNLNIATFANVGTPAPANRYMDFNIPKNNIGIIVKEHAGAKTLVHNGDVVIGFNEPEKHIELGAWSHPNPGNYFIKTLEEIEDFFAAAEKDLKNLNHYLWNQEVTGKIVRDGKSIELNLDNDVNIFNLEQASDIEMIRINYDKSLNNSTIIIKVSDDVAKMGSVYLNNSVFPIDQANIDNIVNRIIYVLDPNISDFEIKNTFMIGTFLAPYANINFTGDGSIDGTVIANGINGSGTSTELHYLGWFQGSLGELDDFPTELGKPTDSVEPSESEKPTDPVEPSESEKPTDPVKPIEPSEPEKPTDPAEPAKPIEPSEPEKPTNPVEPTESSEGTNLMSVDKAAHSINNTSDRNTQDSPDIFISKNNKEINQLPKTGDEYNGTHAILGIFLIFLGFLLYISRKSKDTINE